MEEGTPLLSPRDSSETTVPADRELADFQLVLQTFAYIAVYGGFIATLFMLSGSSPLTDTWMYVMVMILIFASTILGCLCCFYYMKMKGWIYQSRRVETEHHGIEQEDTSNVMEEIEQLQ